MKSFTKFTTLVCLSLVTISAYAESKSWKSFLKEALASSASNTTTNTNNNSNTYSDYSSRVDLVLFHGETPVITSSSQAALLRVAYVADHNPSQLTGKNLFEYLNAFRSPYGSKIPVITQRIKQYYEEKDTFKKAQLEKEFEQVVKPYYQPFRGYNIVSATTPIASVQSILALSHYDLNSQSFRMGNDDKTTLIKYCDIDMPATVLLSDNGLYSPMGAEMLHLIPSDCELKITDSKIAQQIESWVSNGQLKNSDIKYVGFYKMSNFLFKPISAFIYIQSPVTGKVVYTKILPVR